MTTKEAFETLITRRGSLVGLNKNQKGTLHNHFKKGKITLDKMEEVLSLNGCYKKPEVWRLPADPNEDKPKRKNSYIKKADQTRNFELAINPKDMPRS
jgi:hypothetical protein